MNTWSVTENNLKFRTRKNTSYLCTCCLWFIGNDRYFLVEKAFNKVDFPTLGLPTKLTKPETCPSGTFIGERLSVISFI